MANIDTETTPMHTVTKSKLRSIMEAASALTALGDDEETGSSSSPCPTKGVAPVSTTKKEFKKGKKAPAKRYIPDHKKPDAALTFPEKMMNLMKFAEQQNEEGFCVAWLADGKSFVIRRPDEFTRKVLPKFFKATKFSSFTRKLYRWGFRQVNRGIGPDEPIIFGNDNFQRDVAEDMTKMRSITAASARKEEVQTSAAAVYGVKRQLDGFAGGPDQKRVLLDHLIQQKAASLMSSNANMYGALPGSQVSLTSALRPNIGLGVPHGSFHAGGLPAMMSKHMEMLGQHQSNSLMNNFMPQPGSAAIPVGAAYPSGTSTADIVNAAISALRYAS